MGMSADADLAYGYDLGGPESGWSVEEAGEYGDWEPPWADGEDIVTAAEKRLLQIVGEFTETDWRAEGYYDRKRAAEARVGVKFVSVGHCNYGGWILAARHVSAWGYSVKTVDLAALEAERVSSNWDDLLAQALRVLEFTPKQTKPAWLLAPSYG